MGEERAVCLMSGGIDSTVLAAQLRKQDVNVTGIFVNYGQENLEPTWEAAQWQAQALGVTELRSVQIPFDWSKSSVLKGRYVSEGITEENVYAKDVKAISWVPARNAIILLMAGGIASEMGIRSVYASFQFDQGEWAVYDSLMDKSEFGGADLTPEFLMHLNQTARFCYKGIPVSFYAPFVTARMDAAEIVSLGRELGVNFDHTYSCRYYVNGGVCNECEQCVIRARRLAGVFGKDIL